MSERIQHRSKRRIFVGESEPGLPKNLPGSFDDDNKRMTEWLRKRGLIRSLKGRKF